MAPDYVDGVRQRKRDGSVLTGRILTGRIRVRDADPVGSAARTSTPLLPTKVAIIHLLRYQYISIDLAQTSMNREHLHACAHFHKCIAHCYILFLLS